MLLTMQYYLVKEWQASEVSDFCEFVINVGSQSVIAEIISADLGQFGKWCYSLPVNTKKMKYLPGNFEILCGSTDFSR